MEKTSYADKCTKNHHYRCMLYSISITTDILTKLDLGTDNEGEKYNDIMEDLGFGRDEFDEELIKTINNFEKVGEDPEKLFELEKLDMLVFRHILHNYRNNWIDKYPKAFANLWDKLFVYSLNHINSN